MTSIRLETRQLELAGKVYELRCNMAVLDALQEAHGGNFGEIMDTDTIKIVPEILAAMLNDYAEDQGWPTDWTARKVSKLVSFAALQELDVLGMFTRAVIPPGGRVQAAQEPGDAGN